jgi:hypothetical protein
MIEAHILQMLSAPRVVATLSAYDEVRILVFRS